MPLTPSNQETDRQPAWSISWCKSKTCIDSQNKQTTLPADEVQRVFRLATDEADTVFIIEHGFETRYVHGVDRLSTKTHGNYNDD